MLWKFAIWQRERIKKFQRQTRFSFTSGPLFLRIVDHNHFSDLEKRRGSLLTILPGENWQMATGQGNNHLICGYQHASSREQCEWIPLAKSSIAQKGFDIESQGSLKAAQKIQFLKKEKWVIKSAKTERTKHKRKIFQKQGFIGIQSTTPIPLKKSLKWPQ